MGFHSFFNLLGPLTNPAGARYQVLGTFAGERLEQTARVLAAAGQPPGAGWCTGRTGWTR